MKCLTFGGKSDLCALNPKLQDVVRLAQHKDWKWLSSTCSCLQSDEPTAIMTLCVYAQADRPSKYHRQLHSGEQVSVQVKNPKMDNVSYTKHLRNICPEEEGLYLLYLTNLDFVHVSSYIQPAVQNTNIFSVISHTTKKGKEVNSHIWEAATCKILTVCFDELLTPLLYCQN